MEREKAKHPVKRLCRVLGVAPSGYWAWRNRRQRGCSARALADAQLTEQIRTLHQASRRTYEAPRVFTPRWRPRGCAAGASGWPA